MASRLELVKTEVTAYSSDQDENHIVNANLFADDVLFASAPIPGAYSPDELGLLVEKTVEYRSVVSEALGEAQGQLGVFSTQANARTNDLNARLEAISAALDMKAEAVLEQLSAVGNSIAAERQKLATILSEQQGQFSIAQETRSKEFTESIRLANEGFTKLITDYQGQFSAAQDSRSKDFTAAEVARQTRANELIAEHTKRLNDQDAEFTKDRLALLAAADNALESLVESYSKDAKEILEDVKEKQRHVEKLVGVIGNLGVTSGYLRAANHARWGMWSWQAATIIALVTLSTLAYKTLGVLESPGGKFNWGGFAGRALLLVSLGVIAAYSGSQADKLSSDERMNRKLALELEAIGPYLAPLPVEEQNKFRLQIGERSFGRDHEHREHHKSPASILDLFNSKESKELLKTIIEAATKAKDAKP
jgi:hypothetical protein